MRNKISVLIVLIWLIIAGCGNDFFPDGLYGYQVERLLSNDTSKLWQSQQDPKANYLLFELDSDSLTVSELGQDPSDTFLLGRAKVSSKDLLFTDSLLFADNTYWIISEITSQYLTTFNRSTAKRYVPWFNN
jgi:hypothetical protein